ncbi:response regulator transcription factor [Solimonas sp. SE-A11]|uniref:response regulator transcription factor n=1 Tax=Solimonas sp. SE-A11 TaxID=3054954 RepID=UPI00259D07B5|nr:helix-turn-helix transcriptional regulator [Solimonas sp. SE-A11]MDM4772562.1 helix-turn-helix transcriptional regulator [Solimonas sp. SE-A11]
MQTDLIEQLTPRESEVLERVARGIKRREVAQQLGMSINTVKYHLRNAYGKLGACHLAQAIGRVRSSELQAQR